MTLLRPPEGEKIIGATEFAWQDQPGFKLKPGEQYELIVWGEGEDPLIDGRSPVGATVLTAVSANLTGVEDGVAFDRRQDLLLGGAAAVAQRNADAHAVGWAEVHL